MGSDFELQGNKEGKERSLNSLPTPVSARLSVEEGLNVVETQWYW